MHVRHLRCRTAFNRKPHKEVRASLPRETKMPRPHFRGHGIFENSPGRTLASSSRVVGKPTTIKRTTGVVRSHSEPDFA